MTPVNTTPANQYYLASSFFNSRSYQLFEAACKQLGQPDNLPDVSGLPEYDQEYMVNHYMLITIIKARKNGKVIDFTDGTLKFWPYGVVKQDAGGPAGFGFSGSHYDGTLSYANVGSRLCFSEHGLARETFNELEEMYLINSVEPLPANNG